MRLRIVKTVKEPELPMRVLKETESHQYQFFGDNGFIGRSPCRGTVKKLIPQDVMNRADMCQSDFWEYCNLVDGKGIVLDTITRGDAQRQYLRGIYRHIAFIPSRVRVED